MATQINTAPNTPPGHVPTKWLWLLLFIAVLGCVTYFILYKEEIFPSNPVTLFSPSPTVSQTPSMPKATLSMDPSDKTVTIGENITANINLDTDYKAVDGVDIIYLHYDPNFLKVVDADSSQSGTQITPGTLFPLVLANAVNEKTGTIKFSAVSKPGSTFSGQGILAKINFKAIAAGSSKLTFDFNVGSTTQTIAAHAGQNVLESAVGGVYRVINK